MADREAIKMLANVTARLLVLVNSAGELLAAAVCSC